MKRMLVDATHPEETRVAIVETHRETNRLEDFDFGLASKPILRGNIYLAKVMRIEPSLQAAFVEYGGNRHGFLPFSEIHPDYFRIPVADRSAEDEEVEEDVFQDDSADGEEDDGTEPPDYAYEQSQESDAPQAQEESAPEERQEPDEEKQPDAPLPVLGSFAENFHDDSDPTVGLITDFGNAVVGSNLTEVAMPEALPENVGGDVQERFVRPHRQRYKIQEVVKRGQVMLIQVVKEERGNKGAALTSFLSLAGRYCVLMPNTDHGGGVSRKITNHQDRRRMKEILDQLDIPEGMAVILRTAGMEQDPPEIQRDLEYLLRLWDNIREQTLQSSAPSLIYEEANLIKRSVRDLYTKDISEILVAGKEGYERASDFMRAIMPDEAEKIKLYEDPTPLFVRYQVENQIDALNNPVAQLRSGGYLVINPTEALVSIDVNSGRATRERHIEETAVKTNLEASDEIARQLRLRDLAGLVVIDFIDMEDGRNNAAVERRLKEAMKNDRARLQIGRISPFGLMELSRQRLRPSLTEINFEKCPHCTGTGYVRSPDSAALSALRAIEEEALRGKSSEITLSIPSNVAVFILNHKRSVLSRFEEQYKIKVIIVNDDHLPPPGYKLEKSKGRVTGRQGPSPAVNSERIFAEAERDMSYASPQEDCQQAIASPEAAETGEQNGNYRGNRRNFRQNNRGNNRRPRDRANYDRERPASEEQPAQTLQTAPESTPETKENGNDSDNQRRGRRRGRRGGRRRNNDREERVNQPDGNNWKAQRESSPAAYVPPVAQTAYIPPISIHDLDTTPRPVSEDRASIHNRSYEIVNPPGEKPKAGWWRRITGQ